MVRLWSDESGDTGIPWHLVKYSRWYPLCNVSGFVCHYADQHAGRFADQHIGRAELTFLRMESH